MDTYTDNPVKKIQECLKMCKQKYVQKGEFE